MENECAAQSAELIIAHGAIPQFSILNFQFSIISRVLKEE